MLCLRAGGIRPKEKHRAAPPFSSAFTKHKVIIQSFTLPRAVSRYQNNRIWHSVDQMAKWQSMLTVEEKKVVSSFLFLLHSLVSVTCQFTHSVYTAPRVVSLIPTDSSQQPQ